jgi:branched-chain amino acid transport system substrate-binding protein
MIRKLRFVTSLALLFVTSLALATGDAIAQEIKIGVIMAMTGPLAFDGATDIKGAQLAMKEINAKGGVLGRKINLVIEDGECKPAESVGAAEKLMFRDKVLVLMGAFCSGATLAVMPIAQKNKIPLITGVSSMAKLTEMGNEWFFRNAETDALVAQAFARVLNKDMKLNNAYFLAVNDDWGRGTVEAFKDNWNSIGGKTAGIEFVDRTANDFYTPLTKIRATRPDVIIVAAESQAGSIIAKQAKELGIESRIFGVGAWATPTFMDLAGEAANGLLAGVVYAPTQPGERNKTFVANYEAAYSEEPGKYSAAGYNTIHIIAQAIEHAGAADPEKIRAALEKTDYTGPNGRVRFDEKHQAYGLELVLVELQNKVPMVKATSAIEKP